MLSGFIETLYKRVASQEHSALIYNVEPWTAT
jgi:hypothetical protein